MESKQKDDSHAVVEPLANGGEKTNVLQTMAENIGEQQQEPVAMTE
jgi:hypothetical protein